jgi:hypothetical protein
MGLTDTLYDVVDEIELYQKEFPEKHADRALPLRKLKLDILFLIESVSFHVPVPPGFDELIQKESEKLADRYAPHEASQAYYEVNRLCADVNQLFKEESGLNSTSTPDTSAANPNEDNGGNVARQRPKLLL